MVSPPPMPIIAKAGMRSPKVACAPRRLTDTMPSPMRPMAALTMRWAPTRAATWSEMPAPTAIRTAMGTNAAPAVVAENPRTCWRYSEVKK